MNQLEPASGRAPVDALPDDVAAAGPVGADAPVEPPVPDAVDDPVRAAHALTEATVVARAQDGDAEAFAHLVRSYEGELFRLAYRMTTDRGDAEDVVQDAFVQAWRRLPSLTDPQAFHAWIYQIVTRQALNSIRSRTRRRTDLASGTETDELQRRSTPAERGDGPADSAQALAQRRSLDAVLATLPVDQRTCWVLKDLHGLSYPEISYATGVPVSTVRGRIARARQHLAVGMVGWR